MLIFLLKNVLFIISNYLSLNFEKNYLELSKNILFYYSYYSPQKFFNFSQGEIMRNTITEIKNFYKLSTAFDIFLDITFILSITLFLTFYKILTSW